MGASPDDPTASYEDAPLLRRAVLKVASTSWGSRVAAANLHIADRAMYRLTSGRHTVTSMITGLPIAMVTATGARSGQARTVPLIALPTDNGMAVVGSNYGGPSHPGWVHNLRADPHGSITLTDDLSWDFLAREVEGAPRSLIWNEYVRVHPGYTEYEQRASPRHIAVFDLERR